MSKWLNNEMMTTAICIASEVADGREPTPDIVERFKEAKEAIAARQQLTKSRYDYRVGETCREYLARVTAPGGEVNGGEAALE